MARSYFLIEQRLISKTQYAQNITKGLSIMKIQFKSFRDWFNEKLIMHSDEIDFYGMWSKETQQADLVSREELLALAREFMPEIYELVVKASEILEYTNVVEYLAHSLPVMQSWNMKTKVLQNWDQLQCLFVLLACQHLASEQVEILTQAQSEG
jgi:hypothetical protein